MRWKRKAFFFPPFLSAKIFRAVHPSTVYHKKSLQCQWVPWALLGEAKSTCSSSQVPDFAMLEHIWHSFRFRSWENSWKKLGEFHQHVNIQITHKNVQLRSVHASHSLKVVAPVHSPTRMLLKLMDGYLNAWWSHVRSIMASAGDFGMMWCNGRWAARWWMPGCSPFFLLSWHFLYTDVWKCAKQGRRGLISALFSNSLALREEMAADETPWWRAPKAVSRHEKNNVCLHTTDISCTWALIMNERVFGRTFNSKVGSLLSLPWNDTPVASRVK